MKFIAAILILFICFISKAQTDSLQRKDKLDTLILSADVDSVFSKFTLPDSLPKSFSKLDSITQTSISKLNSVVSTVNQPIEKVNQSAGKLTSLPSRIGGKGDLLQNAIYSKQPKIKGLDSARMQVDSVVTCCPRHDCLVYFSRTKGFARISTGVLTPL